ncbi:MAG: hypothetical protein AB8G22_07670 [Saprospiraceae bacterium]
MQEINFHNKTFQLLDNSANGKVDDQTVFKYQQQGDLVTADYHGGTVIYGKIIARLDGSTLQMLYHCYTVDKELKAGKATAKISLTTAGKIKLSLDWQWLDNQGSGSSTYIEI